jgi:hypothetical protein
MPFFKPQTRNIGANKQPRLEGCSLPGPGPSRSLAGTARPPRASRALPLLRDPDLSVKENRRRPGRPWPCKVKNGWRFFPPDQPTIWDAGSHVRTALRIAYERESRGFGATHASPRPHIRRAHWHHYWTGPTKEPRKGKSILKWLHPILIGLAEDDSL